MAGMESVGWFEFVEGEIVEKYGWVMLGAFGWGMFGQKIVLLVTGQMKGWERFGWVKIGWRRLAPFEEAARGIVGWVERRV